MKREESFRLARVGAFMILCAAALVLVVALLGRSRSLFSRKALLHTSFDNISGLVVGAPVRLAGVDIGIVQKIHFDQDLKKKEVHVVLGVDSKYLTRVRQDSVAQLGSKGLLGDMIVNISVGSENYPPLKDGSTLRSQENVGLAEVISSVQNGLAGVSDLVGTVDKRLRSVLSEDMSRDLGRFVHSLANVTEGIERGHGLLHALIYEPRLAESATGFVDDAQKSAARLGETLRRIDAVMLAIEKGNGTLHSLVYGDDGAKLVAELSHTAADLGALVAEVRRGHGLLHSLVYEEGDRRGQNLLTDLSAAARIMRTLAEEAQQGKGTVGGLLRDPTIYEDLKLLLGKVTRNVLLKAAVRAVIRSEGLKREAEPKIE